MAGIYESFGVAEVVNCVGYATRVGGSCPRAEVLDAMRDAQSAYVEIDDLQAAASRLIAERTGAEGGVVTCGAAAGLTLAAAACLAGADPDVMDRLPDVSLLTRNEIIYPKAGPFDYEHGVRLSGARLIEIDYQVDNALAAIEAAITPRTAALGYAWYHTREKPDIAALAGLAQKHGLPLIVDAAMALPPVENLQSFIRRGASLVVFSGGKHLGGPQNSGILCGRRDLVRSAWVQMVDMDVRAGTWSLQHWVREGWISRPPRHGIGRSMKVGKDAIVGLMAALAAYPLRDHGAELATWRTSVETIARGLSRVAGLSVKSLESAPTGQPYSVVQIDVEPGSTGIDLKHLIERLRAIRPKIILCEDTKLRDRAYIYPMCLRADDPAYIIASITKILGTRR
jgi:D-glucosaminate-6-phosphate ammonia-lyase